MSTRPNSREKILDAAEDMVKENGAVHLTLDAVSAKAGVSKGGLLYHFPTKDAMVQAMVQRIAGSFVDAREKMSASLPSSPGRVLKAYILSEGMFRQKKYWELARQYSPPAHAMLICWIRFRNSKESSLTKRFHQGLEKPLLMSFS